jgi:predicted permease
LTADRRVCNLVTVSLRAVVLRLLGRRSCAWIDDLRWDVRHSARLLRRNPAFALTAIVSLATGIGANTAVFTVAQALLFRDPAGVATPSRLVDIGSSRSGSGFSTISYPTYLDIRERSQTLQAVYVYPLFPQAMSLADRSAGAGSVPVEQVFGSVVSANYFAVLGAVPAFGHLFRGVSVGADPESSGAGEPLIVLSYRFWTRRFNADPAIVGRTLTVNAQAYVVCGVAAEGFHGTGVFAPDVWVPVTVATERAVLSNRKAVWLNAGGRLKAGVSVAQASAELDAIGRLLARERADSPNATATLRAVALSPLPGGGGPMMALLALLAAIVFVVLLIACANVAGVLLARAAARRREIAMRLAIGAGRWRLVRQLLVETLLLFAMGAAAGFVFARAATSLLLSSMPAMSVPVDVRLALDARAVAFTGGLAFVSALMAGLAPAFHAATADVLPALKDDMPLSSRLRLRHAFLVGQIAGSVILVVIAGLFARALLNAGAADPGFDARGVELASLDLALGGYTDVTAPLFVRELIGRVTALPNVAEATVSFVLPGGFERLGLGGVAAADTPAGELADLSSADWNIVEPRYFATLRMTLVAGRDFTAADVKPSQPVAIVGEGVVRRFWPRGQAADAVGRYLRQRSFDPRASAWSTRTLRVVGVARDPAYGTLLEGTTGLYVYVPVQQQYLRGNLMIVARSKDGRRLADELRAAVVAMNPALPIVSARTAEEYTSLGLLPQRIVATTAGGLGVVGLLLAAIGVYGVTAYAVARRTREFGVRIALGATTRDIVAMVLWQGMRVTAAGLTVGLFLAAGAGSAAAAYLFGVTPIDPATFAAVAVLFTVIGLAACYAPARCATEVDPVNALRAE